MDKGEPNEQRLKRRITDLERVVTHMTVVVEATHEFVGVWTKNAAALRRLTAPSDQFRAVDLAVARMADAINTIY